MSHHIPIQDLKNTADISQLCKTTREPIFITKNGCEDMVIMSVEVYEEMRQYSIYEKLMEAEEDIEAGKLSDAHTSLRKLKTKYEL